MPQTPSRLFTIFETFAGQKLSLAVAAFEDAIVVLGGFFKSVLGDVEKAVQWLSYIFDWNSIKAYKDQIVTNVNNFLGTGGTFQNLVTNTINPAIQDVHSLFQSGENTITQAISSIQAKLGGMTAKTLQQNYTNNNDPKTVFTGGSYSQSNMLFSKLKDGHWMLRRAWLTHGTISAAALVRRSTV